MRARSGDGHPPKLNLKVAGFSFPPGECAVARKRDLGTVAGSCGMMREQMRLVDSDRNCCGIGLTSEASKANRCEACAAKGKKAFAAERNEEMPIVSQEHHDPMVTARSRKENGVAEIGLGRLLMHGLTTVDRTGELGERMPHRDQGFGRRAIHGGEKG